jgi:DNA transposition AAA+ family ATPase
MNNPTENRLLSFSIRHSVIEHPGYLEAMQKIELLHQRSSLAGVAGGLLITGHTGSGKSTIKTQYAERYPRKETNVRTHIRVLIVDTPSSPTVRSLVAAMLTALGDPASQKGTAEEKTERLYKLLKGCGVELLIIDEFQHFLDRGKFSEACTVTDWLKNLLNRANIPVVLIGLPRSAYVLELNEQLRRRFSSRYSLEPFAFSQVDDIQQFRAVLNAIQQQLPIRSSVLSEYEIAQRFHIATYGLMDYLAKLIDGAIQIAATRQLQILDLRTYAEAFAESVWRNCPSELNPFSDQVMLRSLTGRGEPFSFVSGELDNIAYQKLKRSGRIAQKKLP